MAGVGDDACFDEVSDRHLKDCGIDEIYCVDEMLVDWMPKGKQLFTVMRGCAKEPARRVCDEYNTPNIKVFI